MFKAHTWRNVVRYTVTFFISIYTVCGFSWNALGHMVVAEIAYHRLNPDVRVKVDNLLATFGKEYPEVTAFYQIGPWADSIRSQKIDIFAHWHYIDIAFSADGTPLKDLNDSDNIIYAINKMVPVVQNSKANVYERARFLAFLTHMVGDIHQPLHTVARITAEHPSGDLGGNLYHVEFPPSKPKSMTLHKLWDQGIDVLTGGSSFTQVSLLSYQLTAKYPESFFGTAIADLNLDHWSAEGKFTATSLVYSTPERVVPSEDYIVAGRMASEQKIVLAGYRLASLLNKILA